MSCYTRHLADLLPASPKSEDRHTLDQAIRDALGMPGADCPEVWEQVQVRRDDEDFLAFVTARVGGDV
ncbi:MAG TPA: hypothetical protein VKA30_07690 [Actinomycetota bacterium]|nr:hypothetical protein [Actinomycetota bacterium]